MQAFRDNSVRLFFFSGVALLILSFVGVFYLAILTIQGISEEIWGYYFSYLLILTVSALATYFMAIGAIGWLLLKRNRWKKIG